MEVEQQPAANPAEAKVGENLGLMNRGQFLDGLQLQNEAVLNNDVHDEVATEINALVHHRQFHLPPKRDPPKRKLLTQRLLKNRFEQPQPQYSMHFDRRADHAVRQWVALVHCESLSVFSLYFSVSRPSVSSVPLWFVFFYFLLFFFFS